MSERNDECRYCGTKGVHGTGCLYSPSGMHEEVGDADHCIYCGSTSYGTGCLFANPKENPKKLHKHGHGKSDKDGKLHCIWCGKIIDKSGGYGCLFSPSGKHQL